MSFAATWMHLEIVILREVSEIQKDDCDTAYMQNLWNRAQMSLFIKKK